MTTVRFMTLTGKYTTLREQDYPTKAEAVAAIEAHAASGSYSKVKPVEDYDGYMTRYTATTPGGRGGRNIAYIDWEECPV